MNNELTQLKMDITELKTDVKNIVSTQNDLRGHLLTLSSDLKEQSSKNTQMFLDIMNKNTVNEREMMRELDAKYAKKYYETATVWFIGVMTIAVIGYLIKSLFSQ